MKKRTLSLALTALILMSAILATAARADVELPIVPITSPAGPGDADGDGSINAKDIIVIMHYLVGKPNTIFYKRYADYNGDGSINSRDILELMLDMVNGVI